MERIAIDATMPMPMHRHGMNYRPEIARTEAGSFEARGLFFHMPGLWRVELLVYTGGRPVVLTHDIETE